LQHHAGLNMERGLHSVHAGQNDHSCLYLGLGVSGNGRD
jgi:hypothetical protein